MRLKFESWRGERQSPKLLRTGCRIDDEIGFYRHAIIFCDEIVRIER